MSHNHVATEVDARKIAGDVVVTEDGRPPFIPGYPYEVCVGTGPEHGPHIWHHTGVVTDPIRHLEYWGLYEVVLERSAAASQYPGLLELATEWARQRDAGIIAVEEIRTEEYAERTRKMEAFFATPQRSH